jgi:hypothetical protein
VAGAFQIGGGGKGVDAELAVAVVAVDGERIHPVEAAAAPVVHMRHTDCRHLYLPLETLSQSVMAALAEQLSQQITPTETMGRRATIRL